MGLGTLVVLTTTADEALPIANAKISVTDNSGKLLFEGKTDANGVSASVSIEAPDVSLTLDPNYKKPAYSTVNVDITAPGFTSEHISGVEIVDTQIAHLPVNMQPLAPGSKRDNYIDIGPIALLLQQQSSSVGANSGLGPVFIPDYIRVKLGAPSNSNARIIRVKFSEYIKNVASREIYSTWPANSLRANIHAITTYALNRVYTEWYPAQGYAFDITNSTQFDMAFQENGMIYQSISNITDEIFNQYAHRQGFANPFFTSFCAGPNGYCAHGGMSQWGTVTLANQGKTPLQILQNAFGSDILLTTSNNVKGITVSYPGITLGVGSTGPNVQRMQNMLNRIRINYPAIPRIENPNGIFGTDTESAVKAFQKTVGLTQDGVIGKSTWNRITNMYVGITKMAQLDAEGDRISIGPNPPNVTLSQGSSGANVRQLQFILNRLAAYYSDLATVIQDGAFDTRTRTAVIQFQQKFGLTADGVVGAMQEVRNE